tara:strand:+ start:413 stop:634 length:222 start_codon:yes stop_codon:yes gene_type:complete
MEDARATAVRADKKVGRGSCSYIDETMDEGELLEELERVGAKTPAAAVKHMRWLEALWAEQEDDIRREADVPG